MSLNLASTEVGVVVSSFTSACPGCPPSNTLVDAPERVWLSSPSTDNAQSYSSTPTKDNTTGLSESPQSLTLDFEHLSSAQPSVAMHTAGVYCWHSYSSNPKVITVHASTNGEMFHVVGKYIGKGKPSAGLILFPLDRPVLLNTVRFLRFDFEETYGGNQVYVNRLHLYESTPNVVRLFVDDHATAATDPASVSTPATTEATSMVGERIDDSLAKLQESLVYQYSSGLDDSLNDLALSNIRSGRNDDRVDNRVGNRMGNHHTSEEVANNEATKNGASGFGVHLHRSGSMDIHIPSTVVGANGVRPTTHVRIHGGGSGGGNNDGTTGTTGTTGTNASHTNTKEMVARDGTLSLSKITTRNKQQGKSVPIPELSTWEISQARRIPLSEQLSAMCEQVANLADRRGIRDRNNLRASALTKETTTPEKERRPNQYDTEYQSNGTGAFSTQHRNKQIDQPPNEAVLLQGIQTSLSTCVQQASALEERVSFVETQMISMQQTMKMLLESNGGDSNATPPLLHPHKVCHHHRQVTRPFVGPPRPPAHHRRLQYRRTSHHQEFHH